MSLLTVGNPKTAKGEARGWYTAVLHLSPANEAGLGTVCPMATAGCMATCLNTAGRGGIFARGATTNAIQEARKRRTAFYKLDRAGFESKLAADIARHVATAKRMRLRPAIRVNGTSDLPGLALAMARRFPDVQFYDYTKLPRAWERAMPNYHLTFSRSESNAGDVDAALAHGVNVAVVFSTKRGRPLPATWYGRTVVDGDAHDLRFLDPAMRYGAIIGLRAKGRARRDTSGFVVAL
jgi:hypothetical protein